MVYEQFEDSEAGPLDPTLHIGSIEGSQDGLLSSGMSQAHRYLNKQYHYQLKFDLMQECARNSRNE